MDVMATGCEDGRWIELAQDSVQKQALTVLNPALPERQQTRSPP